MGVMRYRLVTTSPRVYIPGVSGSAVVELGGAGIVRWWGYGISGETRIDTAGLHKLSWNLDERGRAIVEDMGQHSTEVRIELYTTAGRWAMTTTHATFASVAEEGR
jgi:hypothetical protein